MAVGKLIVQFWLSATILSLILLLSFVPVVFVLRSNTFASSENWTAKENGHIRLLKIGTLIAVVLCWIGALLSVAVSPLWVNGGVNWLFLEGDTQALNICLLGVVTIGLPMLSTAYWIKLMRHNWSDGDAPNASTCLLNYSLWLVLIWSKPVIGW